VKRLLFISICLFPITISWLEAEVIFDFKKNTSIRDWRIVDDGVMGGISAGQLRLDEQGNGIFYGYVSLENYGGFSSLRLRKKVAINGYSKILIKVYGDNKVYQLRVRSNYRDRHVYVKNFFAKSGWQEIEIPLRLMEPQFRGRKLRMANFNSNSIIEFGILIGNKVEEQFSLKIDHVILK